MRYLLAVILIFLIGGLVGESPKEVCNPDYCVRY